MKTIAVSLMVILSLGLWSCKNASSNKQKFQEAESAAHPELQAEKAAEALTAMDSLVSSLCRLGASPIVTVERGGQLVLSEKEKQVRPTYLLPPSASQNTQSLKHEVRLLAILRCDMEIAAAYGMPIGEYKDAIERLLIDIDCPIDVDGFNAVDNKEAFSDTVHRLYAYEQENKRVDLFWEMVAAAIVEHLYIVTRQTDAFIICFNDRTASDVSYRLQVLRKALVSLSEAFPDMESLNTVLEPLYGINAVSVQQLSSQLNDLKTDIASIRARLIEG